MPVKPDGDRSVLGSAGNRIPKAKKPGEKARKTISQSPEKPVAWSNASSASSLDSSSSSSSGSNAKSCKNMGSRRAKNSNGVSKAVKVVRNEALMLPLPVKRCDWITPNSESLYTCFHDEEWGLPVHDDTKLFELLVLSQALAELSWPVILTKRAIFRKLFDNFVPASVSNLDLGRLLSVRVHGTTILTEPKMRAVVENAKQVLKIQEDFGSFSNYCWGFVNHKPIKSGFRYARQVPAKTPKSELMSKDLVHRGFRCVGPTVVYSFMQVAGLVNDHLVTCFRYKECSHGADKQHPRSNQDTSTDIVEKPCCKTDESQPDSCLAT